MVRIDLDGPADFDGWRNAARQLAMVEVAPCDIVWRSDAGEGDLFAEEGTASPEREGGPRPLTVPRKFLDLAELAICHRDPERFTLLYRLLCRLQQDHRLLDLATDSDVHRLDAMVKSVRRDRHKMTAFVRFKEVAAEDGPLYLAWFEPDHHIVALTAPFFAERFATMRWSIITPDLSVSWADGALTFGPGGVKSDVPADDAGDALWRIYYANIFNPARLKTGAMKREMPVRYWKNLPESRLIAPLVRSAQAREAAMVNEPQDHVPKRAAIITRRTGEKAVHATPEGPLAALKAEAVHCTRCDLYRPATQTVFGEGLEEADLVFVGEQPGDKEDLAGKPFVGPAGAMFDRALEEAGIDRKRAYVTNAVKHFKFEPRGKRRIHKKPDVAEINACRWWIEKELAVLRPRLTIALGATAIRSLTGRSASVLSARGSVLESAIAGPVFVTVHPSFLLRLQDEASQQAEYAKFVADLRSAREIAATRAADA